MSAWSRKRQFIYLAGFLAFWLLVFGLVFFIFKPAPSCNDGKKNQDETGIDCGGSCPRACRVALLPLKVLWVRPLLLATSTYDVAALIENQNPDAGIKKLKYVIRLYDEGGALIVDRENETYINPAERFPIFESGFNTGNRIAKTATIDWLNADWLKAKPIRLAINIERIVEEQSLSQSPNPKLKLRVKNLSLVDLSDFRVFSYLFDDAQNIFAASGTLIERLDKGETRDIYLTWPKTLPFEPASIANYWRIDGFHLGQN